MEKAEESNRNSFSIGRVVAWILLFIIVFAIMYSGYESFKRRR